MSIRTLKAEFLEALFGEDDLGVVIRTHIHIESSVNRLLNLLISLPDELPQLRYDQKLKLCCAMGMDKTLYPALKALGNLRNAFGHNIDTKLTSKSISQLLAAVSPDDMETIGLSYTSTRTAVDKALPKSFSELEPKSQLIGFAIWLNAALDAMQEGVIARVAQKPVVLGPQ